MSSPHEPFSLDEHPTGREPELRPCPICEANLPDPSTLKAGATLKCSACGWSRKHLR